MFKRIFLFILTNIAIIFIGTIIIFLIEIVFGVSIGRSDSGYTGLVIFALIYGFLGSFLSLFLSRWIAKRAYDIHMITEESLISLDARERLVYQTVSCIASQNNIKMPEVGIYQSPEVNAFATGASKNSSLVAVSSGLLHTLQSDEVEAVVAHEMAHILNGDMVTMTLLQGVINAFVIFLSRAIAQILSMAGRSDSEGRNHLIYFFTTLIFEILLGVLGSLIVMAYSRHREFSADAGSASFVGKNKMIKALRALQKIHPQNISIEGDSRVAALKIDGKSGGFGRLFASHPPLEDRIARLNTHH